MTTEKDKSTMTPAAEADAPKTLVRVTRTGAGLTADVREAPDADTEKALVADGFVVVKVQPPPFVEYPKWVYHQDGRAHVVKNETALEALGPGFEDTPPLPPGPEPHAADKAASAPHQASAAKDAPRAAHK